MKNIYNSQFNYKLSSHVIIAIIFCMTNYTLPASAMCSDLDFSDSDEEKPKKTQKRKHEPSAGKNKKQKLTDQQSASDQKKEIFYTLKVKEKTNKKITLRLKRNGEDFGPIERISLSRPEERYSFPFEEGNLIIEINQEEQRLKILPFTKPCDKNIWLTILTDFQIQFPISYKHSPGPKIISKSKEELSKEEASPSKIPSGPQKPPPFSFKKFHTPQDPIEKSQENEADKSKLEVRFVPKEGAYYKIINKFHLNCADQALFLCASCEHQWVYRTTIDNDGAQWKFERDTIADGYYKILNKASERKGTPLYLEVNEKNGEVDVAGLSGFSSNASWKFTQDTKDKGFYTIQNRGKLEPNEPTSKRCSQLDAETCSNNGHVYMSEYDNNNTKWLFIEQ